LDVVAHSEQAQLEVQQQSGLQLAANAGTKQLQNAWF